MSRPRAHSFDHVLRYWVPSFTTPGKEYLVQFDSLKGNGECQCKWFETKLRPLLEAGVTAADAVAHDMVHLHEKQRPEDALRCRHIVDGMLTLAEDFTRAVAASETETKPE